MGKFVAMAYPLANALYQWEEGARDLAAIADPRRRRLAAQLADLYGEGTDWAQQVAIDVAPAAADEAQALADAAFWAYLRGAGDYSGGRSLA